LIARREDGTLIVPARAEDGDIIGDGVIELRPRDEGYEEWRRWLAAHPDEVVDE
jgi:hypothetical protein